MNFKARTAMDRKVAPKKPDKPRNIIMDNDVKREKPENKSMVTEKGFNRRQSRRERKIALQQDVDKLREKLRYEENVHRALKRAFTRPLGALPRLPPYLPSHTLELLAEVAVLEEEVVRLEEQVMNFRKGLYEEAIYSSSSSKKPKESGSESSDTCSIHHVPQNMKTHQQLKPHANSAAMSLLSPPVSPCSSKSEKNWPPSNLLFNGKQIPKKLSSSSAFADDWQGKENQSNANSARNFEQSMAKKISKTKVASLEVRQADAQVINEEKTSTDTVDKSSGPNKLSEEILKCLMNIYSGMSCLGPTAEVPETLTLVSTSLMSSNQAFCQDPYDICVEFGRRDIGPYKMFQSIEVILTKHNSATSSSFFTRKLKLLLRRLAVVDLSQLTHHQKLAFWVNIFNSCMMNAYLEQGIPSTPEILIALMPKAMVNVGGHLLSAVAIEHFILRLPYNSKHFSLRGQKKDNMTAMRGICGLEWPELLVTFALSCGSWSSPAVRVYTVPAEKQLEAAKRDYLQAAVGVLLPNKLAIPKLLQWYLLDFTKDMESLMDWICLQLPSELRAEAVKCLEMSRSAMPEPVQVRPYEFRFRYLLAR